MKTNSEVIFGLIFLRDSASIFFPDKLSSRKTADHWYIYPSTPLLGPWLLGDLLRVCIYINARTCINTIFAANLKLKIHLVIMMQYKEGCTGYLFHESRITFLLKFALSVKMCIPWGPVNGVDEECRCQSSNMQYSRSIGGIFSNVFIVFVCQRYFCPEVLVWMT